MKSPKQAKQPNTFTKKKKREQEDDISKKFDEMEEILLELKKKEEMKSTNISSTKDQNKETQQQYQPYNRYEPLPSELKDTKRSEDELRLRMFSLDAMAGTKSLSNIMKTPLMKNTKKE